MDDGSPRYLVSRSGHHHHLVCTGCGAVQDLDQCAVSGALREVADASGYEIEGHWLELYGRCAACRAKVAVPA